MLRMWISNVGFQAFRSDSEIAYQLAYGQSVRSS